jgi:hypothetical protein
MSCPHRKRMRKGKRDRWRATSARRRRRRLGEVLFCVDNSVLTSDENLRSDADGDCGECPCCGGRLFATGGLVPVEELKVQGLRDVEEVRHE